MLLKNTYFVSPGTTLMRISSMGPSTGRNSNENAVQEEEQINVLSSAGEAVGWRGFKKVSFPGYGWQVSDGSPLGAYPGKGEEGSGTAKKNKGTISTTKR